MRESAAAEDKGYMKNLRCEILKVLAFYDIFEYPLSLLEIYKNLEVCAEMEELLSALEELKNENKIIEEDGFFYLAGKSSLADKRKARFLISSEKIKRAKKIAKFLSRIPYVKFIGVCNSLGFLNASPDSDIDFFIITQKKRSWLARFIAASCMQIFKMRPTKQSAKDKVCLSFFVDEENLDISSVALPSGDPYFFHWMSWILPVYDDGIYKDFIRANAWIKNFFPHFLEQSADLGARKEKNKNSFYLLDYFERLIKKIQLRIMPDELKIAAKLRSDKSVVLENGMIKLHLLDRREEYREKYREKIFNFQ